jgi:hypothetical protein
LTTMFDCVNCGIVVKFAELCVRCRVLSWEAAVGVVKRSRIDRPQGVRGVAGAKKSVEVPVA